METNPSFLARFHRTKIVKAICDEDKIELLRSPLDGIRIRRRLANIPPCVEYIVPLSIFFDEFTEVRQN